MSDRPSYGDDSVLMRWMRFELGRINQGIVADRKRLSSLLCEERPSSVTKAGKAHYFDRKIISSLGERLPGSLHTRLRLPVILYLTADVPDSCMIDDEAAVEALKVLGEISDMRVAENGRIWIGRAIAYALMRDNPTAFRS